MARPKGGGDQLPQPGALITSAGNFRSPPLPFHTSLKIPHPHKHTHIDKHTHSHTDSFTHTHIHKLTHTETCIKCVNMFGWGIFGAVWKGTSGGQELSAEVIRAPGRGSWNPPFSISLFSLNTLAFFCAPIGAFFRWYPPFPYYTKDFTCRS